MDGGLSLIIPVQRLKPTTGQLKLAGTIILESANAADRLGLEKTAELLREKGLEAKVRIGRGEGAGIRVARDRSIAHDEGYRLAITPKGAEIAAASDAGAFYGLATLRELIRVHGSRLPALRITDWPHFSRRGVYHDCSRGKVPTLKTLKALADRLAEWKIDNPTLYRKHVSL